MNSSKLARYCRNHLLATALFAGLIGAAPLASSATIGISGSTLIAGAEPADGDIALSGFISGTDLVMEGVDFTVVTPGCSGGPGSVSCRLSSFTSLVIVGGDGDDVVTLSSISNPTFAITVLGGGGNDLLFGSAGDDVMFGGVGDDILFGGDGIDLLSGGSGDNILFEGEGDPGPEPVITPLPGQTLPAPGGLALLARGLGALATTRRKRSVYGTSPR